MSIESSPAESYGCLYLVATPIGNLADISQRAIETLRQVDMIAAEDTRHSQHLLNHLGISTRSQAYHEHNEERLTPQLIDQLQQGSSIALISDAGTPLVSDPGYRLVEQAHAHGIRVVPLPGPCAAIAALAAAGLATDRFVFEGFPPAKQQARQNYLETLKHETRTLVFYVSCHRIVETLCDLRDIFGAGREVTLARELTKAFETIRKTTLAELCDWVAADNNQRKGEIVLVVAGTREVVTDAAAEHVLEVLLAELPVKQASSIAARLTGANKNDLYRTALKIKEAR